MIIYKSEVIHHLLFHLLYNGEKCFGQFSNNIMWIHGYNPDNPNIPRMITRIPEKDFQISENCIPKMNSNWELQYATNEEVYALHGQ